MKINALIVFALGISALVAQPGVQNTNQTFLTGGGCAAIPGVGSPILMVANAHKFIEDALKINNNNTVVKYLSFLSSTVSNPTTLSSVTNYKLVFSIADYNGTKYIGVDFDVSPFGIGSTKINRFLMSNDVARVRQLIDPTFVNRATLSCGDLKFVYSSFGNDPTSNLPYAFPGRNQNSAGLNVLNNLQSNNGSGGAANRVCVSANFQQTTGFFGTAIAVTPVDSVNCLPNENAVAQIRVGCIANTLTSLQLAFNNLADNGTTLGNFFGNPTTPASAITTIDLSNAARVVFTRNTTPNTLRIQTLDANGAPLVTYACGTGVAGTETQILSTSEFLGFGDVFSNALGVAAFDLVRFNQI